MAQVSRRQALGLGSRHGRGRGGSAGAAWVALRQGDAEAAAVTGQPVAFHGAHQAGIATAVQDRMHVCRVRPHHHRPGRPGPAAAGLDQCRRA